MPEANSSYHETVIRQHDEIKRALASLADTTHHASSNVRSALDNMRLALTNALKVPVAVAMIGAVSWLFEEQRIQEKTWMTFCLISMFPWFGDSIRVVLDMIRGKDSRPAERVVASIKLLLLGSLSVFLYS